MTRSRFATAFFFVLIFVGLTVGFSFGPPPGYTGAPQDFGTCIACHSTYPGLNLGPATLSITGQEAMGTSSNFQLQVAWSLPVTGLQRRGFQITARDSANLATGSWTIVQPGVTQKNGSNHMNHTISGVTLSSWSVQWNKPGTAPLPPGPVTFYTAGNYADGNLSSTNDYVHTARFSIYQAGLAAPNPTWSVGATETLLLDAPTVPGHTAILVASDSPNPTPLGPFDAPIDLASPLVAFSLATPSVFQNFVSVLDGVGQSQANVAIPNIPALSGFVLHFAYATVAPVSGALSEISNRVTRTIN